jgi:hypothetical protein
MPSIDVQADIGAARDGLRRLSEVVGDLRPTMRAIAEVLADIPERAFRDEQDPVAGEPSEALSKTTAGRNLPQARGLVFPCHTALRRPRGDADDTASTRHESNI